MDRVWTELLFRYGLLLVVLYIVWYVFRGRTAGGVRDGMGEPRPTVAKLVEDFATLVGVFYLAGMLGSLLGWGAMGAEEIVGYSLVFALEQYCEKLTLFFKGRRVAADMK